MLPASCGRSSFDTMRPLHARVLHKEDWGGQAPMDLSWCTEPTGYDRVDHSPTVPARAAREHRMASEQELHPFRVCPWVPVRNAGLALFLETLYLQDPRLHQEVHGPQLTPQAREDCPWARCPCHQETTQRRASPGPTAQGKWGR